MTKMNLVLLLRGPLISRAYYFLSPFGAITAEIRVDLPFKKGS